MEATHVPLTSAVASEDKDTNRSSYDSDFERQYRQALELLETEAAKKNCPVYIAKQRKKKKLQRRAKYEKRRHEKLKNLRWAGKMSEAETRFSRWKNFKAATSVHQSKSLEKSPAVIVEKLPPIF